MIDDIVAAWRDIAAIGWKDWAAAVLFLALGLVACWAKFDYDRSIVREELERWDREKQEPPVR